MAINFVPVRRVDDHARTAELAEESLPVWEGIWERIPDQDTTGQKQPADGSAAPTSTPKTRPSRSSAASIDKE